MHFKKKINSVFIKIKEKAHKICEKIKQFLIKNDVEVAMWIGIFFISLATFKVNYIAFLYQTGLVFIFFSVFLLKYPRK